VRDPTGRQVLMASRGYRPVLDGVDLTLTMDRNVQSEAERILREGIQANKASSGNIVVLDARTAAVLAMANFPTSDPARYGWVERAEQYINTSVSAIYEPGSVLKPLTLAAALETRVIRATDTYDDRGEIIVANRRILNSDRRAHGLSTMEDILAKSLNVGAAHVAIQLGPARYYEMMRRFGLGEATGIDLAQEEIGIMRVPGDVDWHMSDLGANSYGQGISLTPIQVASAYVALANGGLLMRPHVVREVRSSQGVEQRGPYRRVRVLSPDVSETITRMMVNAMERNMPQAMVPGFHFAGKSGTASIPDQEGYRAEHVIASYAGFGPVPNPRFVILVKFDKPREGYWGGTVAAPEFARLARWLVDYYGVSP
ncbi:MAG: penicillin-binding protein 2, partial [Chloroflexota bacterium]